MPAVPGCHAIGKTLAEAQAELFNVFDMIAEEYEEEGRTLTQDVAVLVADAG